MPPAIGSLLPCYFSEVQFERLSLAPLRRRTADDGFGALVADGDGSRRTGLSLAGRVIRLNADLAFTSLIAGVESGEGRGAGEKGACCKQC